MPWKCKQSAYKWCRNRAGIGVGEFRHNWPKEIFGPNWKTKALKCCFHRGQRIAVLKANQAGQKQTNEFSIFAIYHAWKLKAWVEKSGRMWGGTDKYNLELEIQLKLWDPLASQPHQTFHVSSPGSRVKSHAGYNKISGGRATTQHIPQTHSPNGGRPKLLYAHIPPKSLPGLSGSQRVWVWMWEWVWYVGSGNFVEKFYEQQTNFVWLYFGNTAPWVGQGELISVLFTLLLFLPSRQICIW